VLRFGSDVEVEREELREQVIVGGEAVRADLRLSPGLTTRRV